ncbi:dimer_Tnp_hAT domain-containing protein [Trichonephila clavipes]|nr:dimer_Tnp_hAT domain-containing protein [Trichonephila clavipes]
MSGFQPDSPVFFMLVRSRESGYLGVYLHGLDTRVHVDRIAQPKPPSVRIRFGLSTLDLPLPLFPSNLRRGKGPVAGSRCQSIIVLVVAYDGLKAVTHHSEAKKHKECESAAAMSPRMKSFFTPKDSAQSEKVDIAELTEFYHSIKHHISYVAQDCFLKVLKQVINDSDIIKQMTGGRTKCTALVNHVLFPYSMEPVQEDLKNDVPFSVATDASNKEFFCSAKKREDLKECFDFFESEYREVIRHVPTRWLSLFNALDRMLSSWGPLKVHVALKKGHLPDHEVEKFTKNATNAYHRALAYIEKWYPFENQNYKTFSCLNLECGRLPTLDQLLELWSISPWKQQTPPEQIYYELAALQSVFPSLKLEGNSIEMWCKFFQKEEAPNLLKIVQFVCSVPVSIAFVERIFSAMGNVWTNERYRLAVNTALTHCDIVCKNNIDSKFVARPYGTRKRGRTQIDSDRLPRKKIWKLLMSETGKIYLCLSGSVSRFPATGSGFKVRAGQGRHSTFRPFSGSINEYQACLGAKHWGFASD